jgi:hypothetical protein
MRPLLARRYNRHSPDDIQFRQHLTTFPPAWRTASPLQPSDGVTLVIGPRLEGHLSRFSAFGHTPPVVFTWPSIPLTYAGAALRRRSSIRLRIFRNSSFGTATSANWNVTYRPWLTTLAPIFTISPATCSATSTLSPWAAPMSAYGYKRRFGPRRWHDRSTSESRPSNGNIRFLGVEVRSTSDSRRRWARSARTVSDPERTFIGFCEPAREFRKSRVPSILEIQFSAHRCHPKNVWSVDCKNDARSLLHDFLVFNVGETSFFDGFSDFPARITTISEKTPRRKRNGFLNQSAKSSPFIRDMLQEYEPSAGFKNPLYLI